MNKNEIIYNYKRLKYNLEQNKSCKKDYYTETDNLEKEFPVEVIASHFERRLLNIEYNELKEFWDFLTNEDVNMNNLYRFIFIINNEIFEQIPNFKVLDINQYFLNEFEIEYLINWYKEKNGDKIKIKSIKKGYTKTLKIQDK